MVINLNESYFSCVSHIHCLDSLSESMQIARLLECKISKMSRVYTRLNYWSCCIPRKLCAATTSFAIAGVNGISYSYTPVTVPWTPFNLYLHIASDLLFLLYIETIDVHLHQDPNSTVELVPCKHAPSNLATEVLPSETTCPIATNSIVGRWNSWNWPFSYKTVK